MTYWDELEKKIAEDLPAYVAKHASSKKDVTAKELEAHYSAKYADMDKAEEIRWLNGTDRHAVYIRRLEESVCRLLTLVEMYAEENVVTEYYPEFHKGLEAEIAQTKAAFPDLFDTSKGTDQENGNA